MTLSAKQRDELEELAAKRVTARRKLDAAQAEFDKTGIEISAILNRAGVDSHRTSSATIALTSQTDWRQLDVTAIEKEFPIAKFPELYAPQYQAVKSKLNTDAKLPAADSRLIRKYCGTVSRLTVKPLKAVRRGR